MSGNHQQSRDSALNLVRAAANAGARFIKFQVYTPDTITFRSSSPLFRVHSDSQWSGYTSLHDLYSIAFTPWDWIRDLFSLSISLNLVPFASPFDSTAVTFLESLDCSVYKIASPEITDHGLIEACCKTGKPIILSTGLASIEDLDSAVDLIRSHGNQFAILKCVSAYPTPNEHLNLSTIPWLKDRYGCSVGLSDHTLGFAAPLAATALGASLIEKHFKLPDDTTSVDAAFSLSISELPHLTELISQTFASIGQPTLDIPPSAQSSISGRRSLFAVADISEGDLFTSSNIRSIRPNNGLHPKHLQYLLGRPSPRSYKAGEPLTPDLLN